ncbi:hypothetical protein CDAR_266241 [Caerostris darwini]|uniref:Uncharacterized protein n=1 Tax=Caerostris darwini TaxID=1538125 RepID=A0AAV4R332_9ARAC|nr:hypothetical protein CDAR_266241 [Caerostris darwini]
MAQTRLPSLSATLLILKCPHPHNQNCLCCTELSLRENLGLEGPASTTRSPTPQLPLLLLERADLSEHTTCGIQHSPLRPPIFLLRNLRVLLSLSFRPSIAQLSSAPVTLGEGVRSVQFLPLPTVRRVFVRVHRSNP